MAVATEPDLMDTVIADVRTIYPDLDVAGLPIVGRVLRLAQQLAIRREQRLAEFGLSVADFDVLASLRRRSVAGPVNVRDLQQSTMLSSGGMTKRLDRLEAAGCLVRQADPTDRRGVLIELTPSGRKVIDKAIPSIIRSETDFVRTALVTAHERIAVENGLRRLLQT